MAEDQFLFGQYLRYHSPLKAASQRRWNGLISEIAHQRTDTGTVITNGYFYDNVGRLTDHIRYDGNSQTNKYTERDLSFDRNGNILTLKRYGTSVAAPQDNLAYTYEGNKLMQLNGSTYQYDANGNMTHDGRRGLDLSWNHLNLPSSICSDEDEDALVNYTYLADGTKVITQQPATGEGYAYLGSATYKLVNNVWTLESVPFTGGRFIAGATGGMDEYRYITDHLGSTRVIVTSTDYHEVEHNDYYPFGMRIADSGLPTTQNNRWRFSGKEIQTLGNIGLIDFGARMYDDYIGRWITQDPIAGKYLELTPFGYCGDEPVSRIDSDGRDFRRKIRRNKITISAVINVNEMDKKSVLSAKQAASMWNKMTETIGKKTVVFKIEVNEVTALQFQKMRDNPKDNNNTYEVNTSEVVKHNPQAAGITLDNVDAYVREDYSKTLPNSSSLSTTGMHEIGHILGMSDASFGIMSKSQDDKRTAELTDENKKQLMTSPHGTTDIWTQLINWFQSVLK